MHSAERKPILFHNQRGGKNCENRFVELVVEITNSLNQGERAKACVLEFSKTFEKVNH